jgi:iron complex outermembrane receptor protein
MIANTKRRLAAHAAGLAISCSVASIACAQAISPVNFSIPSQDLGRALSAYSRLTGLQVAAASETVRGRRSQAVTGAYSPAMALARLTANSGVEAAIVDKTVVVRTAAAGRPAAPRETAPAAARPEPVASGEPDDIVVTGYQLQNRRSIGSKRDASVISEFVTQDDAGQNPDFNIADALRRVPGVAAVFDEDEGRYVAVRGLNPDYTLVTFNGLQLASSDQASRRVLIEQVPASAVSRMEVIKSPTAQYDGNAIGGIVDLQTRSAFDVARGYFVAQALAGYYDSNAVPGKNKVSYRGDATLTTRFGSDGQFGLVLTGSYLERTRDQERLLHNGYTYYTPQGVAVADPRGKDVVGVPSGTNYLNYTLTSKRYGGAGALEFKPDDHLYAQVYYGHYSQDDDETRYGFTVNPSGAVTPATATTGSVAAGRHSYSVSQFVISKPVDVAQARISYDFGRSKLSARASYSQSRWDERGPGITFQGAASAAQGYRYDIATPGFTFNNPNYLTTASNFPLATVNSVNFNVRDRAKDAQIDYETELGNTGLKLAFGGKYKDTDRLLDREQPSWTSTGLTLADFLRESGGYVPPYASIPVLIPDRVKFWTYFKNNPTRFTYAETAADLAGLISDYDFKETVKAGYLLLEHKGERHLITVGGRYEGTEVDISRYISQAGVATPTRSTNDYHHFLPSAVGSYDITNRLKVRAAYGRAIGRPNQADVAGGETRSDIGGIVTVSRPNPDLKPRVADNFDLSVEYYLPGNNGIISAGVFHKRIKNEIFRGTQESLVGGVTYRITEPQNLQTAKLTGFEINFVRNRLDFLPGALAGIGVSANFTYIDTDAQIVMADGSSRSVSQILEQPAQLLNASIFYRYKQFEGRLSYSRPGKSYQSISTASPVEDVMYKPFNQLDLQLRYAINDHVQLVAEGRNLLGESRDTYRPYFGEIREINQHGRGFWAGVSARF